MVGILTAAQVAALEVLQQRRQMLGIAETKYEEAVVNAFHLGIPHQDIADRLGQTETAVRTWLRRRGYRRGHRDFGRKP